jgi:hypothetical protein
MDVSAGDAPLAADSPAVEGNPCWRIAVFTAWFHAPVVSVPQFSVVKLVDSISIISIGAFVFKSGGHFPACVVTFGMLWDHAQQPVHVGQVCKHATHEKDGYNHCGRHVQGTVLSV